MNNNNIINNNNSNSNSNSNNTILPNGLDHWDDLFCHNSTNKSRINNTVIAEVEVVVVTFDFFVHF